MSTTTVEIPEETKQIMRQRVESIVPEIGREGSMVMPKSQVGKCMAVFTSGGDSQGMNAAVRAVACENLLKHNITNMVCIGGDGSLTGANQFRQEWPSLLEELVKTGRVPPEKQQECPNINIVGLVGSIDNDFCGTDMTIGTDTALHRIVEAVDAVVSTAHSHRRSFVIEVMGRHCGYLALVAALAAEAEWVFIPEWPPPTNWPELLCRKISEERQQGQRLNILIVAEGAIDQEGNIITSEQVKNVVKDRLHYDTRVTVLGHVQRGGFPSAYDRLLGCRMGAEAVLALMEMSPETEPCVVSIDGNQIVRVPLMQCVERTKAVQKAMDDKNWELAVKLRGRSFQRNLDTYRLLTKLHIPKKGTADFNLSGGYSFNVAVMNIGSPACGMNATVRSFARMALYHNCKVYGIQNSFEGLMHGDLKLLTWNDVTNWSMYGGSFLGTQKQLPIHTMGRVAEQFRKHRIHGLLLVGGFEAFHSALLLAEQRDKYPEFCIPIVVIAATISNNVPGTRNFIIHLLSHHGFNEVCTRILKLPMPGLARRVVTSLWPKQTGLIFL